MPTCYLQSVTIPIPSLPTLKQNPLAQENYAIFSHVDSQSNCMQNFFTVWFLNFVICKNSKKIIAYKMFVSVLVKEI